MIVEEVEMTSGQPLDLGQRILHPLRVESPASLKEGILVAEVTMLRTPAGYDDGIRHQIVGTPDEVAANWRNTLQCAAGQRGVNPFWLAGAKVFQGFRKGLFSLSQEDSV